MHSVSTMVIYVVRIQFRPCVSGCMAHGLCVHSGSTLLVCVLRKEFLQCVGVKCAMRVGGLQCVCCVCL